MKRKIENKLLLEAIKDAKQKRKGFWNRVAYFLSKPRRKRIAVNVSKINKYSKEGLTVVIPGKVLGDGLLEIPVIVVAFNFSESAKRIIEQAGGKAVYLNEFLKTEHLKDFNDVMLLV